MYTFLVVLDKGINEVVATAGVLKDQVTFNKVKEQNMGYVLPESEGNNGILDGFVDNIQNWFDKPDYELEVLIFPEGYYSIKDKIKDIIKNEDGDAVLIWRQCLNTPCLKWLKGCH